MIESFNYIVGKSPENAWRRNNLLAVHGCIETPDYFEVRFKFVEYYNNRSVEVNLLYQIVK